MNISRPIKKEGKRRYKYGIEKKDNMNEIRKENKGKRKIRMEEEDIASSFYLL